MPDCYVSRSLEPKILGPLNTHKTTPLHLYLLPSPCLLCLRLTSFQLLFEWVTVFRTNLYVCVETTVYTFQDYIIEEVEVGRLVRF